MPPPKPVTAPAGMPRATLRGWLAASGYAWRRAVGELRRPLLWVGMLVAGGLAWAGIHLEILGLDDRPDRAWGLILSTAETFAILIALAARIRGADLAGAEGWSDVLRASPLGAAGLSASETVASTVAAWVGGITCAMLLLVLRTNVLPLTSLLGWSAALLVELALLSAWVSLAATWLGRLPGLGLAVAAVVLGRAGVGDVASALWPAPAPLPPELPSLAGLAAGLAATLGLTILTTRSLAETRTLD